MNTPDANHSRSCPNFCLLRMSSSPPRLRGDSLALHHTYLWVCSCLTLHEGKLSMQDLCALSIMWDVRPRHHHARHSANGAVSKCGSPPPRNTSYKASYGSLRTRMEQIGTSGGQTQICLTTYWGFCLFVCFEPGVCKTD